MARAAPPRVTGSRINREARDRFDLTGLIRPDGRSRLSDIPTARAIAFRINQRRDPVRSVQAGELAALGLIDELQAALIRAYEKQVDPQAFAAALDAVEATLGEPAVDSTLEASVEAFPPDDVRRGERDAAALVDEDPEREAALRDLVITWLDNVNPAVGGLRELVDDRQVAEAAPPYPTVVDRMDDHFAAAPRFGGAGASLLELLRAPALAAPTSLAGQLRFIRANWVDLLGDEAGDLIDRLQIGLDVISEEERALHLRFGGGGGGGGTGALLGVGYDEETGRELEVERFSQDLDWMPRLVLIAKSTYVWLDQLARQYRRDIHSLDVIPDEELDRLAQLGITGLWLIGLWERSTASREIKRRRGDAEAEASAYSLEDYVIAADIGGPDAYANLRDRAWSRGIRLASDMVPNHMGLDSRWVVEHPDWFLSLPFPPYPAYSFNGPDLSHDGRVAIVLEDHYWDGTDAAVVFKRADRQSGDERYIYHGNDGTSFPWNDTAQLDFLNPAVREAVIQTILHVARQFPVIRFDAAMVLAKKHIQRLWHPLPGQGGGAIPSRAEHSMPKREFDRRIPVEFWREVVDRVAAEAPGTLLLAEAFWLMEGYFVRTLGMHRVYNSAFMNLLRDERNADYRKVMRETLEFDPEILKRFVNFMNNPDEKTASEQFGTGDKYFGIATLMATMPGLPMYGHGQFEGFTEKYGMEFRRARWQEEINQPLYEHHVRAIVPLLHRRYLFAEVRDFLLYDVVGDDGGSRDDVFAYSNLGPNGERSLVVYHNRFGDASGWIRDSVSYSVKVGGGSERTLVGRSLAEGLGLDGEGGVYWLARDWRSGLEHLWSAGLLRDRGLFVDLHAYECRVFLDWRQVRDDVDGSLWRLAERLGGGGVPSVEEARTELLLEPIREPFWRLLEAGVVAGLVEAVSRPSTARRGPKAPPATSLDAEARIDAALATLDNTVTWMAETVHTFASRSGAATPVDQFATRLRAGLRTALRLASAGTIAAHAATVGTLLAWLACRELGGDGDTSGGSRRSRELFDEWRLGAIVGTMYRAMGLDDAAAGRAADVVRALIELPSWPSGRKSAAAIAASIARTWLDNPTAHQALRVHDWDGVEWFDGDAWSDLVDRSEAIETVRAAESAIARAAAEATPAAAKLRDVAKELHRLGSASGYRVDRLNAMGGPPSRPPRRPRA